jgi:hypothetical protein
MTITSVKNRTRVDWDALLNKIREDDKNRVDFRTDFQSLSVLPKDGRQDPILTFPHDDTIDSREMSERSYRQYLSKLGIQHRQATLFSGDLQGRMILERLDYRDEESQPLVNPEAEIFLRCRPGRIRAILSGRYGNMSDLGVAEVVNGLLPRLDTYEVLRGRVEDHIFSVTLLGRNPVHTNGDVYYPIHKISNSEVGASSFRVSSGVCKGACSNGMIFGHRKDCDVRIRHLGADMQTRVVEALNQALGNVDHWSGLVGGAIETCKSVVFDLADEKQLNRAVKDLRDKGLTKKLATEVVQLSRALPEEVYGDEFATVGGVETQLITRWHLVNAMTQLVQDESRFGELERLEVEEAAGKLMLARAA